MCFTRFRKRWDPKGSVINTFATFLLLSYSKLLTVSYTLLGLPNNKGERVGPAALYLDASIEYFSKHHHPFAVLACNMCPASVCYSSTGTAPPVPHENISEMSWLLYQSEVAVSAHIC